MIVNKLLTEQHLEFLSLKGGCRGSSKSTLVKLPHCLISHVTAHLTSSSAGYTSMCVNWKLFGMSTKTSWAGQLQ